MRSPPRILLALSAVLAVGSACADDDEAFDVRQVEGPSPGSPPTPSVDDHAGGTAAATVRLANLASGLGPIDVCYRLARTGTLEGPLLGGASRRTRDSGADGDLDASDEAEPQPDLDGGSDAEGVDPTTLGYREVSKYVSLDAAGPLAVAIVRAGSGSCTNALLTAAVTLDPGKLSTIVVLRRPGDDAGTDSVGVVAFTDDRATVPDKARVRLVHAATTEAALAVRAVAGQTTILADRVEPGRTSAASETVGALGYAEIAPVPPPTTLAIGAAANTAADAAPDRWQSEALDLALHGGSLHTGFVLDGDQAPFEVLWCRDTSTVGDRTACTLVR